MKTKLGWLVIFVMVGAGGFALWWQHESQMRMQRELGELRRQGSERARLREANRRLAEAQPTPNELENLRADHAALSLLRVEIAALQARARMADEQWAVRSSARFAAGGKVPAGDWKNAGATTPSAALETILWAAAGGDVEAFAKHLLLPDERSRQRATALLESLPPEMRAHYGTPERLIAFLASKDVPLGAAQVLARNSGKAPTSSEQVRLQLTAPDGKTKDLILRLTQQGDGWKLVVPEWAIAKYFVVLKGTSVTTIPSPSTGVRK
ncbi:MAG: hypothetical protein HZA93_29700 [Verrucomicrobia bacterium]|nr:hypothetical protein [Verrucomicrobiota bacterium]